MMHCTDGGMARVEWRLKRDLRPRGDRWRPCTKPWAVPGCRNQPPTRTKYSHTAYLSWIGPRYYNTGVRWETWNAWAAKYVTKFPHRCTP